MKLEKILRISFFIEHHWEVPVTAFLVYYFDTMRLCKVKILKHMFVA